MTVTDHRPAANGPQGTNPLRARRALRTLYGPASLTPASLTAPLLVLPDGHEDGGLPGAVPIGLVPATISRWAGLGIRGIKLFVYGHDRDSRATGATAVGNRMVRAVDVVKQADPDMVVTTEVCGCSWTDHGQCVLRDSLGAIDLEATYRLMGRMAVMHAEAGADVASPTAMLDGAVRAVRQALDRAGLRDVGVNPNLAIHTSLYGPFKTLMGTNPASGDRRGFQLEPAHAERDTIAQARRWMEEGADSLTLQPVMTAVDVLAQLRADQRAPITAYSTSGEYFPLAALGAEGMAEYHAMLKRAGADVILSFCAERVAQYMGTGRG